MLSRVPGRVRLRDLIQTQLTRLMRTGWETVGNILARVVSEKLAAGRLDGLELIGVDEVNYGAVALPHL